MKKKNRFLANKTFVVFSILAVCIILTAVFAPVVTRGDRKSTRLNSSHDALPI